jgi:hypothetical protein
VVVAEFRKMILQPSRRRSERVVAFLQNDERRYFCDAINDRTIVPAAVEKMGEKEKQVEKESRKLRFLKALLPFLYSKRYMDDISLGNKKKGADASAFFKKLYPDLPVTLEHFGKSATFLDFTIFLENNFALVKPYSKSFLKKLAHYPLGVHGESLLTGMTFIGTAMTELRRLRRNSSRSSDYWEACKDFFNNCKLLRWKKFWLIRGINKFSEKHWIRYRFNTFFDGYNKETVNMAAVKERLCKEVHTVYGRKVHLGGHAGFMASYNSRQKMRHLKRNDLAKNDYIKREAKVANYDRLNRS